MNFVVRIFELYVRIATAILRWFGLSDDPARRATNTREPPDVERSVSDGLRTIDESHQARIDELQGGIARDLEQQKQTMRDKAPALEDDPDGLNKYLHQVGEDTRR